jgi:hypothetical protein
MYNQDEIQKAKKRVKSKKDFYQHLMAFVIVNSFLFLLNMVTSPFTWWFFYPMLGWGVGLAFHYVEVFGVPGFNILSKEWEEKELDSELHKMKSDKYVPPRKSTSNDEKLDELELKELRKNYDESEFV